MHLNTNKIRLLFYIGIIALVILAGILMWRRQNEGLNNRIRQTNKSMVTPAPTPTPTPTPTHNETIMVTVHGFVPEELPVTKDTYINFANFSDNVIDVEFDKEKGQNDTDMAVGKININGTSSPIKYSKIGTYHYRNAQKPEQTGSIIIQ